MSKQKMFGLHYARGPGVVFHNETVPSLEKFIGNGDITIIRRKSAHSILSIGRR